jgi:hypothetical protein
LLPFAIAAVSEAALVLPSSGTFSESNGVTVTGTITSIPELNGIQGTEIKLTEAYTVGSFTKLDITLDAVTLTEGMATLSIPYTWELDYSASSGGYSTYGHSLSLSLTSSGDSYPVFGGADLPTEPGLHQGSGTLDFGRDVNAGETMSGTIYFELYFPGTDITINSFTLRLNPNSVSPVPEPSSLLMLSGSAGLLAFYRRRNRA